MLDRSWGVGPCTCIKYVNRVWNLRLLCNQLTLVAIWTGYLLERWVSFVWSMQNAQSSLSNAVLKRVHKIQLMTKFQMQDKPCGVLLSVRDNKQTVCCSTWEEKKDKHNSFEWSSMWCVSSCCRNSIHMIYDCVVNAFVFHSLKHPNRSSIIRCVIFRLFCFKYMVYIKNVTSLLLTKLQYTYLETQTKL